MKKFTQKIVIYGAFSLVMAVFYAITHLLDLTPQSAVQLPRTENGTIAGAYFSPRDDVRSVMITLIDSERKKIQFAIYTITDKKITQALVRAASRGVQIEGVVDRSYGQMAASKVHALANARISLWVYQTSENEREAGLMHNKFMIFEETGDHHKPLVWTGSYNFTLRASEKNQENVVVFDTPALVESFKKYFSELKKASLQISGKQAQEKEEKQVPYA